MIHKGIICLSDAKTNEEYKQKLKAVNYFAVGFIVMGAILFGVSLIAQMGGMWKLPEFAFGFYCGAGCGAIGWGIALLIKNIRLMKNEEKLTRSRIEATDERTLEINLRAGNAAYSATFIIGFFTLIIGSIFRPELIEVLIGFTLVASLSRLFAYAYYSRKM